MKITVKCAHCGKEFEMNFIIPPNDEDVLGWYCEPCAVELFPEEDPEETD